MPSTMAGTPAGMIILGVVALLGATTWHPVVRFL